MSTAKITSGKTKQRVVLPDYKREMIEAYDADNSYPERVRDIVLASGVARACTEIFARYIFGNGISDPTLFKMVVDRKGTTLDKLLRKCVADYALWYGYAIHVQYNAFGEKIGYTHLPFEYCRKGIKDKEGLIAVYDNWDRRDLNKPFRANDIQYLYPYNPSAVISEIENSEGATIEEKMKNYKGQVLWFSKEGNEYPLAPCDPVLEDVQTTYQIKLFKNKNIRTNFMASHMFVHKGKFEDETERQDMMKSLERFQGAEMVGNIMMIEVDNIEQVPQLLPFQIQNNDKLWEYTESSTIQNIVQNYFIPPVLAGILQAGKLGTSNEINEAHDFYNAYTAFDRMSISEEFTRLLGQPVVIEPKSAIFQIAQTV
jgi:hypothetical protein